MKWNEAESRMYIYLTETDVYIGCLSPEQDPSDFKYVCQNHVCFCFILNL